MPARFAVSAMSLPASIPDSSAVDSERDTTARPANVAVHAQALVPTRRHRSRLHTCASGTSRCGPTACLRQTRTRGSRTTYRRRPCPCPRRSWRSRARRPWGTCSRPRVWDRRPSLRLTSARPALARRPGRSPAHGPALPPAHAGIVCRKGAEAKTGSGRTGCSSLSPPSAQRLSGRRWARSRVCLGDDLRICNGLGLSRVCSRGQLGKPRLICFE
jgi:hypothetical protein